MYSYVICLSLTFNRISSVCHWYVLVSYSYVTRTYVYVIRMSLVCILMPSVCHSYVLLCRLYVTRMYSYAIRMSLVCTLMPSVCHSYVLVCHPYVTRIWFYHEPFTKEETNTLSETLKKTKIINNKKYKLNNETTEPPKKENKVECIVKYLKKKDSFGNLFTSTIVSITHLNLFLSNCGTCIASVYKRMEFFA